MPNILYVVEVCSGLNSLDAIAPSLSSHDYQKGFLSVVPNSFATPWTVGLQASLSIGFPRQEYWSRFLFPSPGNLPVPTQGSNLQLQVNAFISEPSVQSSRSVTSDSLRPHESQHTRPPCPSPTPGVYSNSCTSSWSCHPAISSSVVPFSSCPQSLPASGSFPITQLFP